jgi:membrane-associated phospholipid phosphatase
MLAGLVAVAGLSIALGALVTRVIEPSWGIGAADERVNVWLAAHRTMWRTHVSLVGSTLAGGVVLPIVIASLTIICLVFRKWLIAAFFLFVLGVESGSYRATTLVIHSHRPRVVRLERLPVNASYPSGHTAASVAVYGGLALLITSKFTNGPVRAVVWALAVAIVAFVATSRMYRGMHHPLDVAGGVVVGVAAVTVLVVACQTAATVAATRAGRDR